jgi:hypothetical protein
MVRRLAVFFVREEALKYACSITTDAIGKGE